MSEPEQDPAGQAEKNRSEQDSEKVSAAIKAKAVELAQARARARALEFPPKTSPVPTMGDIVIYRTQDLKRWFNNARDHVAIVQRVFNGGRLLNLLVLPDGGQPYQVGSQGRIHPSDEDGTGWFTRGELPQ